MIKAVLGMVGLGGSLIPTGWLIAGAVAAALALLGGTWKAGYNYRGAIDDAATLRVENERLTEAAKEQNRQLDSVNRIQQADTDKAAALEKRNRDLQDQIAATPRNDASCLDDSAADRVFGKRPQRTNRAAPANPASAAGRRGLFTRTNKPPGR